MQQSAADFGSDYDASASKMPVCVSPPPEVSGARLAGGTDVEGTLPEFPPCVLGMSSVEFPLLPPRVRCTITDGAPYQGVTALVNAASIAAQHGLSPRGPAKAVQDSVDDLRCPLWSP